MPKKKPQKVKYVSDTVTISRWTALVAVAVTLLVGLFFVFTTLAAQNRVVDTPNGAQAQNNIALGQLAQTIPTQVFCRDNVCSLNGNTNGVRLDAFKRRSWRCPTGFEYRFRHGNDFKANSEWRCLQRTTPSAVVSPGACAGNANTPVGNGISVCSTIAPQVRAMIAAAASDGVRLSGGGYRSPQAQIAARIRNGCPNIYTSPASSCNPPTAIPGTSMHEQGLAIDFDNCSYGSSTYNWLRAHASQYGLYNLPGESWHWSTTGG